MDIKGISGTGDISLKIGRLKNDVTDAQIKNATEKNGMDELVIQTDKGKYILYADTLNTDTFFGKLPAVGKNVDFGDIKGKVIYKNTDYNPLRDVNESKIVELCEDKPEVESKSAEKNKEMDGIVWGTLYFLTDGFSEIFN